MNCTEHRIRERGWRTALALGLLLVGLGVFVAPIGSASANSGALSLECRVVLQPDDVATQDAPVDLQVLLPGQVGDALAGRAEEESGIDVLSVGTEDSGVTVVTVDTSRAVAGDWSIRFDAEEGTCRGRLTIAENR